MLDFARLRGVMPTVRLSGAARKALAALAVLAALAAMGYVFNLGFDLGFKSAMGLRGQSLTLACLG